MKVMKRLYFGLLLCAVLALASCSKSDYLNVIPGESKMILSIDPVKMTGTGNRMILKTLLQMSDHAETGIDLSSKIYLFQDAHSDLGICAGLDSKRKLTEMFQARGLTVEEKAGASFCVLPNNWIAGFTDQAVLLMGPALPAAQGEMMRKMSVYLQADEAEGIKGSPMFDCLDSIQAPMALISRIQALPEQFVAPFTLGVPKDADPKQALIAAGMKVEDEQLRIKGHTFSFNKKINEAIRTSMKVFRPIEGKFVETMSQDDAVGLFVNVRGEEFLRLMLQSSSIQAMLTGINAAIDMNNIIKSIDGDMTFITPRQATGAFGLKMAGELRHADWLKDVDYWKQSVPSGGVIGDWGHNCYYYKGGQTTYYFGVTPDGRYMSGNSETAARQSVGIARKPLDSTLQQQIKGERMVMVVNVSALQQEQAAFTRLLRPLIGKVNTIVYSSDYSSN